MVPRLKATPIDDPAAEHRPKNLRILHIADGNGEHVAVYEYEVGSLTGGDRADLIELIEYLCGITCVG